MENNLLVNAETHSGGNDVPSGEKVSSDGGMTEIESRDFNFIEDDFPSISEAK